MACGYGSRRRPLLKRFWMYCVLRPVCLYINERYCDTVVKHEKICTPDLELLSLSLQPFFTIVYVDPRANITSASQLIEEVTNRLDSFSPDAPKFILGDFNHCQLHKTYDLWSIRDMCHVPQLGEIQPLTLGVGEKINSRKNRDSYPLRLWIDS